MFLIQIWIHFLIGSLIATIIYIRTDASEFHFTPYSLIAVHYWGSCEIISIATAKEEFNAMNIVVFYSRINYIGVWRNGRSGAEHCYKLDLKEILVGLVTLVLL